VADFSGFALLGFRQTNHMLTAFGALAVTFMMLMYWFELRGPGYVLGFACGCLLSSLYGFLAGAWPFGVVEVIWAWVAVNRYRSRVGLP
jgi:hypothetical protein